MTTLISDLTSRELDWRNRLLGGYLRKWAILGLLIGMVAGLGAIAFSESIDFASKVMLGGIADLTLPLPRGEAAR